MRILTGLSAAFLALSVSGAISQPAMEADSSVGKIYTDHNSMTLYTFDKDTAGNGKSVCNGPCATSWPPLAATAADKATGDYTIVTRDDGAKQWAFKGKPLYLWINDKKPGDKTGDGVGGVWKMAKP